MKIVKKLAAFATALFMLFVLSGCNEIEKAEETLGSCVTALQSGDITAAAVYLNNTDFMESEEIDELKSNQELIKAVFSKMSYKINSSEKIDSNNVKINTEITTVNMGNILKNSLSEMFRLAFSNAFASADKQLSDEELDNKLIEFIITGIQSENAEMVTNTVDINVVKGENGWTIEADNPVIDALTGGLMTAAESLGNAFGE